MTVPFRFLVAALGLCAPPAVEICRADHHMADMGETVDPGSSYSASVSLVAASYSTLYYEGDYQAVVPTVGWSRGRFAAQATIGIYWLSENGADRFGAGDTMVHASATLVTRGAFAAGLTLGAMVPTGDALANLGMGHAMGMGSLWSTYQRARISLSGSLGFNRALSALGGAHHDHGAAPLVDPMNMSELAWSAGAAVDVGHRVRVGALLSGAVPVGAAMGTTRVEGGGRASWGTRRVETAIELQAGIVGDPFTLRGVLETALRF